MPIPSHSTLAADHPRTADPSEPPGSARIERLFRNPGLMTFLVLLGLALRLLALAFNKSLYLDEILLSRSILDLPLRQLLTQPLLFDQVAPRGFLLVERLAVTAFGPTELALRLFPFLAAAAGLVLFRRLAERTLTGAAPALALFLFAVGIPFIRFGADVKQYEVDVTAAIVLTLLALDLRQREASTRRLLLVGIVGFVLAWFSQAAVLVMAGLGFALGVDWLLSRDRRILQALLITIPLWAVASLVAIIVGLRSMTPATREFMDDFWSGGFMPLPLRSLADLRWFWNALMALFSEPTLLRYRWPAAFLIVAVAGVVTLWRRSSAVARLLLGPFAVCMAAAVAHQFPFRGRLVVWLLPVLLLFVAAGAEWGCRKASLLHPVLGAALMLAILVPPVMAIVEAPPPYEIEHHRALLSYLQQNRRPGDVIYVFPLQRIGTAYYGPQYGLLPNEWATGICERNDTRAYIRDVDRYRGAPRFWLLSAGTRPFRVARSSVQSYLNTIGVKKDSLVLPSLTMGFAGIELYDLSNPTRLTAATADTFPVPPMPTDPHPGCRDWVRPDPVSDDHR